jgi:hypothetical protein
MATGSTCAFSGSVTWRNFNPGALESRGGFSERHGAINIIQRYAVFPNEAKGRDALMALLVGPTYINLTLWTMVRRFYGSGPELAAYRRAVQSAFPGMNLHKVHLKDLSGGQLSQLADTIKTQEGWRPGKENDMARVIATRNKSKSNKTLTHFQLEGGGGFITLASAIAQTRQGKIYAVIVEGATPYLRSFPGSEENFDDIVVPNPS